MFFSSNKKNLPRVGELVCIRGSSVHERPYRIVSRTRESVQAVIEIAGKAQSLHQVYIDVVDVTTGEAMERCQVERFSFWPSVGDKCLLVMGPYQDWLVAKIFPHRKGCGYIEMQQLHFAVCKETKRSTEEMLQTHTVLRAEGEGVDAMAAVQNESGRIFKMMLKHLCVLEKADRRTDSQSVQEGQLSLLEESAA